MGLKDIRQAQGLTLKELAEKAEVHYMKIHQIESGRIKPENITIKTALKLAKALDCRPEDLLG